jgi:xylulokinase
MTTSLRNYLLTIDAGTSGCKSIIFNNFGQPLSFSFNKYSIFNPKTGFFEQNPHELWKITCKTIKEAISMARCKSDNIACIGITGQGTNVICLDKKGNIIRPAISYLDVRAKKLLDKLIKNYGFIDFSARKTSPNLLWLKENEQINYKKIKSVLDTKEFLGYKFTNNVTHDSWVEKGQWIDFYDSLGFPREWFGSVHEYTKTMGYTTKRRCKETGIKEGVPVIIGPWDGLCNILGSGLTEKGLAVDTAGTTEILSVTTQQKLPSSYLKHPLSERKLWLTYSSPPLGLSHRWYADTFFKTRINNSGNQTVDRFSLIEKEAAKVSLGSDGLIFLPSINGSSHTTQLKGAFIGLTLNHQRKHISRAVLEGIVFQIRRIYENMESQGAVIKEVRLSGGGAKSHLWNQLRVDIMGKPFAVLKVLESACLGVAILASISVGKYPTFDKASREMIKISRKIYPNKKNHEKYSRLYDTFVKSHLKIID